VEGRLLLDVVVGQRAAVLELLAREDEALLVGRDALLVLDLLLDVVDRVARLDIERDGLARERLDEDLRAFSSWRVRNRFGLGGFGGRGRGDGFVSTGMSAGRRGAAAARAPVPCWEEAATLGTGSLYISPVLAPARPRPRSAMAPRGAVAAGLAPGRRVRAAPQSREAFRQPRCGPIRRGAATAEHEIAQRSSSQPYEGL